MTTRQLARRAAQHFSSGMRSTDRHNRRAWIASVQRLGDKWLLAKPIELQRSHRDQTL